MNFTWKKRSIQHSVLSFRLSERKQVLKDKLVHLQILLGKIGFRWGKTNSDKSVLCERLDIRLKRIEFLRSINRFREEGHQIIYTNETYIHSSHTTPFQWKSNDKEGIKAPVLKGHRLIIVHGGGEMGFIPEALLIFKSGLKTGDYHGEMNIVIDNAPYHNVQLNRPPSSNAKKDTMKEWLDSRGLQYSSKETKIELLPPYHPELNPIDNIWGIMKNWMAVRNVTFKLEDVKKLVIEKCANICKEEWEG
ncbi:hypothetical protein J437_LFUL006514, partial [Ladona fulva]